MNKQTLADLENLNAARQKNLITAEQFEAQRDALLAASRFVATAPGVALAAPGSSHIAHLEPGKVLGAGDMKYRLEALLGHGSFGQVWRAVDEANSGAGRVERVALKVLYGNVVSNSVDVQALRNEVLAQRRLKHRNIVNVYHWLRDEAHSQSSAEIYFIVMEYLEARTLSQVMADEGAMPVARALELLKPVAQALDYAWSEHKIVHRDIKPDNIMLLNGQAPERGIRLLDFGLAARARDSGSFAALAKATEGKQQGSGGTLGYMAPELATNQKPDPRQDVFSLAVTLYAMLASNNTLPFPAMRPERGEPTPPTQLDDAALSAAERTQLAELDVGLRAAQRQILNRALAFNPQNRPSSALAFVDALAAPPDAAIASPALTPPPPSPQEAPVSQRLPLQKQPVRETNIRKKGLFGWMDSGLRRTDRKPLILLAVALGSVAVVAVGVAMLKSRQGGRGESIAPAPEVIAAPVALAAAALSPRAQTEAPVPTPTVSVEPVASVQIVASRTIGYSKISNSGKVLSDSATLGEQPGDWACTKDNTTGLIWEVKTTSGLRDRAHRYSWFDRGVKDGNPGTENGGTCHQGGRCDTEKFVIDVNAMGLCGSKKWRMPTIDELKGIVKRKLEDSSQSAVAIDLTFFPNTPSTNVWSSSPYAENPGFAWTVSFGSGDASHLGYRGIRNEVRLVLGGQ